VAQLDVVLDRPRSRQVIGVALSDDRGLAARLTVRQNLEFFSALYSVPAREVPGRILELAERLEAAPLVDRPVRTLSTGERARAVLIRTLLHKPRVLLLDELTRSLDPGAARRLRQQILADVANEGIAVLFASHDLSEVQSIASRVLLLDHGRIAASGSYSDIQGAAGTIFAEAG
jgi:ABC-2 type transport system ATP-binding protein